MNISTQVAGWGLQVGAAVEVELMTGTTIGGTLTNVIAAVVPGMGLGSEVTSITALVVTSESQAWAIPWSAVTCVGAAR